MGREMVMEEEEGEGEATQTGHAQIGRDKTYTYIYIYIQRVEVHETKKGKKPCIREEAKEEKRKGGMMMRGVGGCKTKREKGSARRTIEDSKHANKDKPTRSKTQTHTYTHADIPT